MFKVVKCILNQYFNLDFFFNFFQTFRRDGNDLVMNHKIGLVEALCGFQFMLKHLDGRQIVVKYPAGKVIEPGNTLVTSLIFKLWDVNLNRA